MVTINPQSKLHWLAQNFTRQDPLLVKLAKFTPHKDNLFYSTHDQKICKVNVSFP